MVQREGFYDIVIYGVASHHSSRTKTFHFGKLRVKAHEERERDIAMLTSWHQEKQEKILYA